MWTGKFFKKAFIVSCAMFVPFCELMAQDEKVYTAEYKFNYESETVKLSAITEPVGTSFSVSGRYKRSLRSSWKDRVYLDKNNVGKINFTNFKYEVKSVDFNVMAEPSANFSSNIYTEIIDYSDNSYSENYRIGSIEGTYFHYNSFLDGGEFSSLLNGLKSMSMKQLTGALTTNTVYYQGANDNSTPTFKISYYEPSVYFTSSMPTQIEWGKTFDVSEFYKIDHKGAFDFTTTYESSDENIFTVDKNGVITPKNLGNAQLTVTITDGEVKKTATKNINVKAPNLGSNQYLVNLKYCDGTDNGETVIATYGQPLPNGLTAPTREGYEFKGYYDNQNQDYAEGKGLNYGGTQYYNKDMAGVKSWSYNYGGTIYGHWAPKIYIVTLDAAGGVLPNPVVKDNAGNFNITKKSNSVMTLSIAYRTGDDNKLVHSTAKKPGYELLGWFDSNGNKIISVDEKSRNCTITDNGGYWTEKGMKYSHIGNITLTAHYRQKYKYSKNVISFDNEKVEAGDDWLWSVVNDLVGAAKDVYETKGEQTMVFDLRKSTNMWTDNKYERLKVMQSLQKDEYKDYISPNVLVYFNDNENQAWYNGNVSDCYNAVSLDNKCKSLVVTDRYEIKVPYAFKADNALYERNKDYSSEDAAKAQAANSQWGTLCLPYPIRNNANNVKFYKLTGFEKSVMHYTPMNVDVIPANTPVLYKRLEGVGSEVKIEEAGVNVPVNTSYSTNPGSSLDSWQFIGTLTTKIFCGKEYDNKKVPAGAEKMDGSKEIYYFKQDQFTHLANKGKVTMLPYRAYFTTTAANAKFTTFSIIAIDEEGATDITNLIDNDAEGDGKIYDLNGRRVMQPVSGRLYIVNGKKKVY
jgi:hypothetical protein